MCSHVEVCHGWSRWKPNQTALYTWFLRRLPDEFLDSDTFVFVEDISTKNLIIMKTFIGSWVLE